MDFDILSPTGFRLAFIRPIIRKREKEAAVPRKPAVLLLVLVVSLSLAAVGCGKKEETTGETGEKTTTEEQAEEQTTETSTGKAVLMNGRSVMGGWFEHWGYNYEGPVREHGYSLDYKELNAEDMAGSFRDNVSDLPAGSVVFFKFCFEDFDGENLDELEATVDEVIDIAKERGLKLIIGNALPMNEEGGSKELVSEYKKYNAFLEGKASENPDVRIYDFYSVLAGPDGFLKPEYDTGDSHPNDDAYTELDATFFPLLDQVFTE